MTALEFLSLDLGASIYSPVRLPYQQPWRDCPPTRDIVKEWPDLDLRFDEVGRNLLAGGGVENLWKFGGRLSDAGRIAFPETSSAAYATLAAIVQHSRCFRYCDEQAQEWWVRVGELRPTKQVVWNALAVGGNNAAALRAGIADHGDSAAVTDAGMPAGQPEASTLSVETASAGRLYDYLVKELSSSPANFQDFDMSQLRQACAEGPALATEREALAALEAVERLRVRKLHLPGRKWAPRVAEAGSVIHNHYRRKSGLIRLQFDPKFVRFVTPESFCVS